MSRPPNKSGGQEAAAKDRAAQPDCLSEIVNRLRQRARFYFERFQRTGDHLDIRRATIMQIALVAVLEARRP